TTESAFLKKNFLSSSINFIVSLHLPGEQVWDFPLSRDLRKHIMGESGCKTIRKVVQSLPFTSLQKLPKSLNRMENRTEILVIDDESQIRKLLRINLESNDYKVHLAETAK